MGRLPVAPPVHPREAFTAYLALRENPGNPEEAIRQKFAGKNISKTKTRALIRFLKAVGLVEGRGGEIRLVEPGIEDFQGFYAETVEKLKEIYGGVIDAANGAPADSEIIYHILREKGVPLTKTGVKNILRTLRYFGLLVERKQLVASDGGSLDEAVYQFIVKQGGYVKVGSLSKTFALDDVELRKTLSRLVKSGKVRLIGVPEAVIMVSNAINKIYGAQLGEDILPTDKAGEYGKVLENLMDIYGLGEEEAKGVIRQALTEGKNLFRVTRDRMRGGEAREYIVGRGTLPDNVILGVSR